MFCFETIGAILYFSLSFYHCLICKPTNIELSAIFRKVLAPLIHTRIESIAILGHVNSPTKHRATVAFTCYSLSELQVQHVQR